MMVKITKTMIKAKTTMTKMIKMTKVKMGVKTMTRTTSKMTIKMKILKQLVTHLKARRSM
jgi:hypothetical protein